MDNDYIRIKKDSIDEQKVYIQMLIERIEEKSEIYQEKELSYIRGLIDSMYVLHIMEKEEWTSYSEMLREKREELRNK